MMGEKIFREALGKFPRVSIRSHYSSRHYVGHLKPPLRRFDDSFRTGKKGKRQVPYLEQNVHRREHVLPSLEEDNDSIEQDAGAHLPVGSLIAGECPRHQLPLVLLHYYRSAISNVSNPHISTFKINRHRCCSRQRIVHVTVLVQLLWMDTRLQAFRGQR